MASRKTKTLFGLSLTGVIFILCIGAFCVSILITSPNPSVKVEKTKTTETSKVAGISDEKKEVKTPESIPAPTPTPIPEPVQMQSIPEPQPTPVPVYIPEPTPQPSPPPAVIACLFSCSGPDRDCTDFSGHAQAQQFFDCCGFTATNDPMQLDGRGNKVDDGIACEN